MVSHAGRYIDALAASGRYCFTTADAIEALGGQADAVRAQLRRLKEQLRIASPMRSFHVLVPPEYRRMGCPPAEHFLDELMTRLGEPYYVALLSAAERHGAAHQRPQSLQVMVPTNRPPLECGEVRVMFIARSELGQMPVSRLHTPRGYLNCATPEVTALELVGYPQHAEGLDHVATVLTELGEEMSGEKLVEAAALSPVGWAQRLGYLLEQVEHTELARALLPLVNAHARSYTPLRRAVAQAGATYDARWKVIVNVEVNSEPSLTVPARRA